MLSMSTGRNSYREVKTGTWIYGLSKLHVDWEDGAGNLVFKTSKY